MLGSYTRLLLVGEVIIGDFALWDADVSRLCVKMGDPGLEFVGKEKLTDPLCDGVPPLSCRLDRLEFLWPALPFWGAILAGPKLDPRPWEVFGGGEAIRAGELSMLEALRCDFSGMTGRIFLGSAGTGGASAALGTGCDDRDGDGSRKVLSDMEPELPLRSKGGLPEPALPVELTEPARLIVLFVWTSATDMGVVGLDRRAAAAAADDSEAFDARLFRNACAAATVAFELTFGPLRGYIYIVSLVVPSMTKRRSPGERLSNPMHHN